MLNKEIVEILRRIKASSIVLFGSYAIGKEKENSDVDVLVVNCKENLDKLRDKIFEKYGKIVSFINLSKEEFYEAVNRGESLLLVIFIEGKVIKDDGTFERGKNLFKALYGKSEIVVKYGGKEWNTKMLC